MRIASRTCLFLAVILAAFAYWGTSTVGGRKAYDEMAGMIPWGAGLLSVVLAVCAIITWWLAKRMRRA
ncbi:MAG: hypothetical protein JWR10_93 [Rubritepida sp.]|nr:hypothetical protein [Rubritepida sp.]